MTELPPDNPAGPFAPVAEFDETTKVALIESLRQAPSRLRDAVAGLSDEKIGTRYRNWTIRQITHHIADSHLHSIIRFKWALTEDHPKIKAYEEADWVQLVDCRQGDVSPAIALLEGLHTKWAQLLEMMTPEQFSKTFHHPQSGDSVDLWLALNKYEWHGRHHTAQILWLREHNGW